MTNMTHILLIIILLCDVWRTWRRVSSTSVPHSQFEYICSIISRSPVLHDFAQEMNIIQQMNYSVANKISNINRALMQQYPSLHVCILTRITPDVIGYAAYSYFVQWWYSSKHYGYQLLPLYPDSDTVDYQYHRKLVPILDALKDETLGCDFVFWMDADFIPLNPQFSVQTIISENGDSSHIWLSRDVSTSINTGGMIFRNTKWTRDFIQRWIDVKNQEAVLNEQLGFDFLLRTLSSHEASVFQQRICILDHHVLNSVAPAMSQQAVSHNILHLAAEDNTYRRAVFQQAAKAICEFDSFQGDNATPTHTVPHQLGLSKVKLLNIAMEIYGSLSHTYEEYLQSALNEDDSNIFAKYSLYEIVDIATKYRTAISKFAHAIVNINSNGIDTEQSLALRSRAYRIMHDLACEKMMKFVYPKSATVLLEPKEFEDQTHIIDQEIFQSNSYRFARREEAIRESLPEMLKLSVELGYEYLINSWMIFRTMQMTKSQPIKDLRNVEWQIRMQLHALQELVQRRQLFTVQSMIDDFEEFVSMINY